MPRWRVAVTILNRARRVVVPGGARVGDSAIDIQRRGPVPRLRASGPDCRRRRAHGTLRFPSQKFGGQRSSLLLRSGGGGHPLAAAGERDEDRISGLHPAVGPGALVPVFGLLPDARFGSGDARVRPRLIFFVTSSPIDRSTMSGHEPGVGVRGRAEPWVAPQPPLGACNEQPADREPLDPTHEGLSGQEVCDHLECDLPWQAAAGMDAVAGRSVRRPSSGCARAYGAQAPPASPPGGCRLSVVGVARTPSGRPRLWGRLGRWRSSHRWPA